MMHVFGQVREILKVSLGIARDVPILRVKRAHTGAGPMIMFLRSCVYSLFLPVHIYDVWGKFRNPSHGKVCLGFPHFVLFLFDSYSYLPILICPELFTTIFDDPRLSRQQCARS